ncbi:siderophore-interacting protein [Orrella sp. JC864]|uniref:siderophore-interacting protein n=1 Tax=Orrella sp. JC864 TaxID=3120298 RepID=UPI0012BB9880
MKPERPVLSRGPVRVKSRRMITPLMVRLTMDTSRLPDMAWRYPAHAVKLFVPHEGQTVARTYTIRRYDAAAREMDLDFLLHGDGPAARWAQHAQAGEDIELAGPRAGFARAPGAAWQLMIGDATALPAIASMLESLPAGDRALALIAVRDAAEEQPIETAAQLQLRWVHVQDGTPASTGHALEQALHAAALPDGPVQVFIAAESSAVRGLRALFPRQGESRPGWDVVQMHATGYWKQGAQDYHDHH